MTPFMYKKNIFISLPTCVTYLWICSFIFYNLLSLFNSMRAFTLQTIACVTLRTYRYLQKISAGWLQLVLRWAGANLQKTLNILIINKWGNSISHMIFSVAYKYILSFVMMSLLDLLDVTCITSLRSRPWVQRLNLPLLATRGPSIISPDCAIASLLRPSFHW